MAEAAVEPLVVRILETETAEVEEFFESTGTSAIDGGGRGVDDIAEVDKVLLFVGSASIRG